MTPRSGALSAVALVALSLPARPLGPDFDGAGVADQLPAPQAQLPEPPPVFRTQTDLVPIYATVRNRAGMLVTDMVEADFEVLDDGKPAPIRSFNRSEEPLVVVTLLDTSGSMLGNMARLLMGAHAFVDLLAPEDQAAVISFNAAVRLESGFSSDRDALKAAISGVGMGGGTRLYDAVHAGLELLPSPDGRRRVLLVFSDGEDTGSTRSRGDALKRAKKLDVMVYVIAFESRQYARTSSGGLVPLPSRLDPFVKSFAEETGGGYLQLKETYNIAGAFAEVAEELRRQYTIAIDPVKDGREHKLELKLRRSGVTARARKSYVAAP